MKVVTVSEGENVQPLRSWEVPATKENLKMLRFRRAPWFPSIEHLNRQQTRRGLDGLRNARQAFAIVDQVEAERHNLRSGCYPLDLPVSDIPEVMSRIVRKA